MDTYEITIDEACFDAITSTASTATHLLSNGEIEHEQAMKIFNLGEAILDELHAAPGTNATDLLAATIGSSDQYATLELEDETVETYLRTAAELVGTAPLASHDPFQDALDAFKRNNSLTDAHPLTDN